MLILTVTLWLGVSATAHAQVNSPQVNSPTNAASTVTGAIVPSGEAASTVTGAIVPSGEAATLATGGGLSPFESVPLLCAFGPSGVSLSVMLTPFLSCTSDPLSATYQISAAPGAVITGPAGSISATAPTATPNTTSGAVSAGGGVSSRVSCPGAIPSMAGSIGASDLFGGIDEC